MLFTYESSCPFSIQLFTRQRAINPAGADLNLAHLDAQFISFSSINVLAEKLLLQAAADLEQASMWRTLLGRYPGKGTLCLKGLALHLFLHLIRDLCSNFVVVLYLCTNHCRALNPWRPHQLQDLPCFIPPWVTLWNKKMLSPPGCCTAKSFSSPWVSPAAISCKVTCLNKVQKLAWIFK